MKFTTLALFCALLISCGSGLVTPPIDIPGFTIPSVTLQHGPIRQPIGVTKHFDGTYTLDTIARVPHKARVRIATLRDEGDAKFIASLWNATVNVTP